MGWISGFDPGRGHIRAQTRAAARRLHHSRRQLCHGPGIIHQLRAPKGTPRRITGADARILQATFRAQHPSGEPTRGKSRLNRVGIRNPLAAAK